VATNAANFAALKGLVTLDEVNDVVRQVVVRAPWDMGQGLVDDGGHDVHVLLEHLAADISTLLKFNSIILRF